MQRPSGLGQLLPFAVAAGGCRWWTLGLGLAGSVGWDSGSVQNDLHGEATTFLRPSARYSYGTGSIPLVNVNDPCPRKFAYMDKTAFFSGCFRAAGACSGGRSGWIISLSPYPGYVGRVVRCPSERGWCRDLVSPCIRPGHLQLSSGALADAGTLRFCRPLGVPVVVSFVGGRCFRELSVYRSPPSAGASGPASPPSCLLINSFQNPTRFAVQA